MFKKFTSESISSQAQSKQSVQRGIRTAILQQYPLLEPFIEDILPKKEPIVLVKCKDHINVIAVNNVPLFYNEREGPYYPTLRVLHKYPDILPHVQADRGAIKHVLAGANIMSPGLTSPGAKMDVDLPAKSIVAVHAEGKQSAMAVGLTELSTQDIKKINKGLAIVNIHFLGDGLWVLPKLE